MQKSYVGAKKSLIFCFKCCIFYTRPYRLIVRTRASQALNLGAIPSKVTRHKKTNENIYKKS
ncbi:hypothetical protein A2641_02720 [Candidatus Nomurabacteria bacterium RIFCSPHIGHO2_01_FULL_37_25]|uniref:Uncharacterized protein n=1 Tax=Candidatus Nomurabacteria bacterium RIFCSPLOWO2_01_FULL_36_16 TaxID=1801767 RepID=A0A1F6X0S4_9BACT|nr:MAG: hypothetical protein A2641_02720 [Candidatus Nomurabacteria bacterium RIFCSPHIGHO2_01_FULL_37_25]OGI75064.1 MAG: hypothetical protein A3D36_03465 [Candidatus Nomurabacteria bacterium RIFCSPHIGHO2_02_FULL_36_29]OGI87575.1 MAG: hypothetical protein A3A91_01535 [Candidatus Nomurabacteria bacterium RIFCSPLOWO2_01_FULL_36_16]OGI96469.1 MAG: hypothetical protein A3I84_02875 [Candidatus Nomurabacteria bacterium RIFCSPLOWO2_02_FULL_36_8]